MTVTEREEKIKVSNAEIKEIKKEEEEEEEEEEDINLQLNELVNDSNREIVNTVDKSKKEQDDDDDDDDDDEKALNNEKENAVEESLERSMKRIRRIAESDDAKSTIKKAKEEVDEDCDYSPTDPLLIMEAIVSEYHKFVAYILQMLKDEEGKEDEEVQSRRWKEILKRGKQLVTSLKEELKRLGSEMEWLEGEESLEKEYAFREIHIPDLLAELRDINARIEFCPYLSVVSDIALREDVSSMCLAELEKNEEELREMMVVIKELKEEEAAEDEEDEETRVEEETAEDEDEETE